MMENELAKEIEQFLGGSTDREEHFKVFERLRKTAKDMEGIDRYNYEEAFEECLRKHGRAAVSVCIAATLWERRERLGNWNFPWAIDVMNLWKWKIGNQHERACVYGNSHPTTICDYARKFIKLNSI